jgi:hypothetical protein
MRKMFPQIYWWNYNRTMKKLLPWFYKWEVV